MIDAVDLKASGDFMELRHIRYFLALAERLNFTQAAAQVHVTQSTLSHQIAKLEEELGQRLFDRAGRRVTITPAGELFLPRAVRALDEIDTGIALLSDSAKSLTGVLRVGTTPTFNIHVIPRCIALFRETHPSIRITIDQDNAVGIAQKVQAGSTDIAVGYHPGPGDELSFEPLCNEEMIFVAGPQHPLFARRRLRVVELHRRELILPPRNFATRRLLDEAFASAGAEPIISVETDSINAMLATVRQTTLATIVSRHAVPSETELKAIPLESPSPIRTPGLIWLKDKARTPAEASFASILRTVTTSLDYLTPARRGR